MRVLFVSSVLVGMLTASAVSAMSLRDAVRHTVETNPTIASSRANRMASGYVLRQSQGRLAPTIDLSGDLMAQNVDKPRTLSRALNDRTNYRRQVGVVVRQVVFDGFERANAIYRDAAQLDAAALTVLQNSETVGLTAVEAYIDVRRHLVLVGVAQRNVRRHVQVLNLIKERAEGGKAPQSDVDQARERLLVAQSVTQDVKRALDQAYAKFYEVVGLRARGLKRVRVPRSLPMTKRSAVKIAMANNPSVLSASADIDRTKFDRERAVGAYAPQVFAEGSATYGRRIDGNQGRSADVRGGVVFSWNLFSGLQRRNRLNEMDARVNAARYERDARARAARGLVERAWAGLIRGRKRASIIRQQVKINQGIVKSYQEEYELGKRSLLDLLDAERAHFNARFQLSSVEAVYKFAAYQLVASTGRLLQTLKVAPPAEVKADHRIQTQKPLGIFNIEIEPLRQ